MFQFGPALKERDVMSYAMYPHVAKEFFKFRETYGPVDKLQTRWVYYDDGFLTTVTTRK